jgi:hypothetical protein
LTDFNYFLDQVFPIPMPQEDNGKLKSFSHTYNVPRCWTNESSMPSLIEEKKQALELMKKSQVGGKKLTYAPYDSYVVDVPSPGG